MDENEAGLNIEELAAEVARSLKDLTRRLNDLELSSWFTGEFDHGDLQLSIGAILRDKQQEWSIRVVTETRTQVSPTRFRVPDVCVIAAGLPRERIIRTPPLLCVEVLSPRDTIKAMRKRCQDFLDMGVPEVWIFDPETRTAHVCTASTMTEHKSGILRLAGTKIELPLQETFATLDQ